MTGNGPIDTLLLIAAVITAVGIIWTKGVRPAFFGVQRIWGALSSMSLQWEKLDSIASQFEVNGGTSLVDRITRIEQRQTEIMRQLEQIILDEEGHPIEWPS